MFAAMPGFMPCCYINQGFGARWAIPQPTEPHPQFQPEALSSGEDAAVLHSKADHLPSFGWRPNGFPFPPPFFELKCLSESGSHFMSHSASHLLTRATDSNTLLRWLLLLSSCKSAFHLGSRLWEFRRLEGNGTL